MPPELHEAEGAADQPDSASHSASPAPTPQAEPGALGTVVAEPVDLPPFTDEHPFEIALRTAEPTGSHSRRFGSITLPVALRARSPDLSQYPCTSCHFGASIDTKDQRARDAHQNIQPVHPKAAGAVCSNCHASDNVEQLAVKTGPRPTLNHSYRLCVQCHSPQVRAWAGGAHGKRLDGWRGRRVVMSCTDCHDPHNPTTERRIPFRAPRITRQGGH